MVSMPRVGRRPLTGSPSRPVYKPVGQGDSYFPEATYDAMATAYGHKETGRYLADHANRPRARGRPRHPALLGGERPHLGERRDLHRHGGAVPRGRVYDPHALYSQLDTVKYQYGCFFSTFLQTGTAVTPAPLALGTPCPTR